MVNITPIIFLQETVLKIAVITGASSGIGREMVLEADRRYTFDEIWVIARRAERLAELQSSCRNKIRPVALDLTSREDLAKYSRLLAEEKPDIALLINAAGCGIFGPFKEADPDKLINSVELNSIALTAVTRSSLDYMNKGSNIVNLGSNSSWQPVPICTVYGASKSYVLNFSRALNRELRSSGIGVMCVCPGWIKSEFQENAKHDAYIKYVDRWYGPDEVAKQAMDDLEKGRMVSILGGPVRRQVKLVKFLPVNLIMDIWCKQQGLK